MKRALQIPGSGSGSCPNEYEEPTATGLLDLPGEIIGAYLIQDRPFYRVSALMQTCTTLRQLVYKFHTRNVVVETDPCLALALKYKRATELTVCGSISMHAANLNLLTRMSGTITTLAIAGPYDPALVHYYADISWIRHLPHIRNLHLSASYSKGLSQSLNELLYQLEDCPLVSVSFSQFTKTFDCVYLPLSTLKKTLRIVQLYAATEQVANELLPSLHAFSFIFEHKSACFHMTAMQYSNLRMLHIQNLPDIQLKPPISQATAVVLFPHLEALELEITKHTTGILDIITTEQCPQLCYLKMWFNVRFYSNSGVYGFTPTSVRIGPRSCPTPPGPAPIACAILHHFISPLEEKHPDNFDKEFYDAWRYKHNDIITRSGTMDAVV